MIISLCGNVFNFYLGAANPGCEFFPADGIRREEFSTNATTDKKPRRILFFKSPWCPVVWRKPLLPRWIRVYTYTLVLRYLSTAKTILKAIPTKFGTSSKKLLNTRHLKDRWNVSPDPTHPLFYSFLKQSIWCKFFKCSSQFVLIIGDTFTNTLLEDLSAY